jgi:hypothetical protein
MGWHAHFAWLRAVMLLTVLLPSVSFDTVAEADWGTERSEALEPQVSVVAASDPLLAAYYIVRFAQYVHWPMENDFPHWLICVPKASDTSVHDDDYAGQTVRGKSFEVHEVVDPAQLSGCQVLDLTSLDIQAARGFLEQAQEHPILTVGSDKAFCSAGGVICLERGAGHLSFEINLSATRRADLRINARLLSLARESAKVASGSP